MDRRRGVSGRLLTSTLGPDSWRCGGFGCVTVAVTVGAGMSVGIAVGNDVRGAVLYVGWA